MNSQKKKVNLLTTVSFSSCFFAIALAITPSILPAQAQDDNQEIKESEEQRLKVMQARTADINSLLKKGVDLYKRQQIDEAINIFKQVIRLDPQNASAYFSMGIALEAKKDLPNASDYYEIAHEIDPGNQEYQKAILSLREKEEKQVEIRQEKAKQQNLTAKAAEAYKTGHYDEALSLYQSLEKEHPHIAFVKYNIGSIYLIQRKPDEALDYYKQAHKLDPKNEQYNNSFTRLKQNIKQIRLTANAANNANVRKSSKNTPIIDKNMEKEKERTDKAAMKNIIEYFGMKVKTSETGVLIHAILTHSRAANVGLQPGDIIQVIDGQKIRHPEQLKKVLQSKPIGQRFQLIVIRGNRIGHILF